MGWVGMGRVGMGVCNTLEYFRTLEYLRTVGSISTEELFVKVGYF